MPRVILPRTLSLQARGEHTVDVGGDTAGAVIRSLEALHGGLRGWIVDEQGSLRRHVKLFVRGHVVTLDAKLDPKDELHVVAAISGG
jgi:molybdopterin converting factor small subunit